MPTIIIYWSPGRTAQQKAAVGDQITNTLVTEAAARRDDVVVIFQNIEPGDSGRAGQIPGSPQKSTGRQNADDSGAKSP